MAFFLDSNFLIFAVLQQKGEKTGLLVFPISGKGPEKFGQLINVFFLQVVACHFCQLSVKWKQEKKMFLRLGVMKE